jgi:glycosyltransferase involved in cell wall biosynthesis
MGLSALMTIYSKESPKHLRLSLESIAKQTRVPDEFVIVKDGPLGRALDDVIDSFATQLPIVCVGLPENVGRGAASKLGVERCMGDLIARVDSDDLCVPNRFESQENFLIEHRDIDVVGAAIAEFDEDPRKYSLVRRMPRCGEELRRAARFRSPVNNVTTMFRREAVLSAGGYSSLRDLEDYHLWARMMLNGSQFYNLNEVLVFARAGKNMFKRRGGLRYVYDDVSLQRYFLKIGFISGWIFITKVVANTLIRLAPDFVRASIYIRFLRAKTEVTPKCEWHS